MKIGKTQSCLGAKKKEMKKNKIITFFSPQVLADLGRSHASTGRRAGCC